MRRCDFACPQVHRDVATTAVRFLTRQAEWLCTANHGSIGDSRPIAFSGCPRGHRVSRETRCPKHPFRLTGFRILTSNQSAGRTDRPPPEMNLGMDGPPQTLKLLVVSDVGRRNGLLSSKPAK